MPASRDIASLGDAISGTANVNFDSNTLFVDSTNNRVGIGIATPGAAIDIVNSGLPFRVAATSTSGYALMQLGQSTTASQNWHIGSEGDGTFRWYNGNFGAGTERMRISSAGIVTTPAQSALRLDGANNNPLDISGSTQLLTSTYYTSNLSRGDLSWNSSTGRVTAATAGYYSIMYQVYVNTAGNGNGRIQIRKNGSNYQLIQTGGAADGTYNLCTIIQLAVNDYVDVIVDSFDPMRLYMGTQHTDFHMFLLG